MSRYQAITQARQARLDERHRLLMERRRLGRATTSELTALVIAEGGLPRETRLGLERLQRDMEEREKREKEKLPVTSIDKAYVLRKARVEDPVIK